MNDPIDLYRQLVLIREFELRLDELFASGGIRGTSHLCAGQEATAVGACAGLGPDDYVVSNHRGHGHFLARGGDPNTIMAELLGKQTGYSRGRGGSQHMACFDIGFLGSNGITGGGIPIAVGAALGVKLQGLDRVVLCFFGDGATNQGTFHEALNMASIWKLPVVFFCENNFYAMSTPIEDSMAVKDIAERAASYAMPSHIVDGNDTLAVKQLVAETVERCRAGAGPELIEAKTYRQLGHSKSDMREYRTKEEERAWLKRDPIKCLADKLRATGELDDERIAAIGEEMTQLTHDAVKYAIDSPDPKPEDMEGRLFA